MSPHLLSVCVAPRGRSAQEEDQEEVSKKLAYLVDLKTISVMNLTSGSELLHLEHDARVDWLELNETGSSRVGSSPGRLGLMQCLQGASCCFETSAGG